MEFVNPECVDQIHKLGEDFTLRLGNMTLIFPQDRGGMKGKERTVTEVKTAREERNLPMTISVTFWWATGGKE